VHIGPHKTGSTHIQTFITEHFEQLKAENLHWPDHSNQPYGIKGYVGFAKYLREGGTPEPAICGLIRKFLQESLAQNHNIILSQEEFDGIGVEGAKRLQHELQGFDTKIVFVYREWMSHVISNYFQLNRHFSKVSIPFSTFLMRSMDRQLPAIVQATNIVNGFVSVFGAENVTVIDLAGVVAANVPIEKVVLCEIAGALCTTPEVFVPGARDNEREDILPIVLFSLFRSHLELRNDGRCHFCAGPDRGGEYFVEQYRNNFVPLPTISSHMRMLVPYAKGLDAEFRAAHGGGMLYANLTASLQEIEHGIKVTELDVDAFLTAPHWMQWMDEQFLAAYHAKLLCDCGDIDRSGTGISDRRGKSGSFWPFWR
jgi:hypothetical protein